MPYGFERYPSHRRSPALSRILTRRGEHRLGCTSGVLNACEMAAWMASFIAPSSSCNVILPLCTSPSHQHHQRLALLKPMECGMRRAGKHRHLVHTGFELLQLLQCLCFRLLVLIVV